MGPFEYKFLSIIVLAVVGALLIVWGGKLFGRAYERGSVEAQASGFSVKAANYGPGVVIFVLGFVLLIFCVTRTFKSTTVVTTNTTVVTNGVGQNGVQVTKTTSMTETTTHVATAKRAVETKPPEVTTTTTTSETMTREAAHYKVKRNQSPDQNNATPGNP